MPGVRRILVGWQRPLLEAVCDFIGAAEPGDAPIDGPPLTVVLPGARAGRVLRAMLAQRGFAQRGLRREPRTTTASRLLDLLVPPPGPCPTPTAALHGWISALRSLSTPELVALAGAPPAPEDLAQWVGLAQFVQRAHCELAGELLTFGDVVDHLRSRVDFGDEPRWAVAAAAQQRYQAILRSRGLVDRDLARVAALKSGKPAPPRDVGPVLLVAMADLNRAAREALKAPGLDITSFVFAPPALAADFDELGCVDTDRWPHAQPIEDAKVVFAADPAAQAEAAWLALAALKGRYSTADVIIGVADEAVVPHLRRGESRYEAPPIRYAGGRALPTTSPFRLLMLLAEHLRHMSLHSLGALLRHSDVEALLAERLPHPRAGAAPGVPWWISTLDRYAQERFHTRLGDRWLTDHPHARAELEAISLAAARLLDGLAAPPLRRPLAAWAGPIADVFAGVYQGRMLHHRVEADRVRLEALAQIRDALEELRELAADHDATPECAAAEALGVLAAQLSGGAIPDPADHGAVEVLGWLEVLPDPSPVAVLTGLNEGKLPESWRNDSLLTDSLRERLGLMCARRRAPRDAYILSAIAASRPEVTFIAGRRSADGDPLWPSRLLLLGDDRTLVRRVEQLTNPARAGAATPFRLRDRSAAHPSEASAAPLGVPPMLDAPPPTAMRVTAFKDFLASPYLFYLRHVLRLKEVQPVAHELEASAFGSLLHEALAMFARSDARHSDDPARIRQCMRDELAAVARKRFGPSVPAVVDIQIRLARRRLDAFAPAQASWVQQGWLIHTAPEWEPPTPATFVVDGQAMRLTGRIDRIDKHAATGRLAIMDYKTGDRLRLPDEAHRRRERWVDLQLPLYRHLAAELLAGDASPLLCYAVLPGHSGPSGFHPAGWDAARLNEADEVARDVVRRVRLGQWRLIGGASHLSATEAAIIGSGASRGDLETETPPAPPPGSQAAATPAAERRS